MSTEAMARALAASTPVDYDCRRCGACCLSLATDEGYVVLSAADTDRLARLSLPIVVDADGPARLGTIPYEGPGSGNACVAFEGAPRFPCHCSIYADRPLRCREFEMGSFACRSARLRVGLPI
jgi:uncharacterized protein